MELIDIYRVFYLATAQYTFFSAVHGAFSKIDHILGHKASLNKYKKIEITPWILSDHNAIKLELNNKNSSRKYSNNSLSEAMGYSKGNLQRKVYSYDCIY
jgi:hypothetical protein